MYKSTCCHEFFKFIRKKQTPRLISWTNWWNVWNLILLLKPQLGPTLEFFRVKIRDHDPHAPDGDVRNGDDCLFKLSIIYIDFCPHESAPRGFSVFLFHNFRKEEKFPGNLLFSWRTINSCRNNYPVSIQSNHELDVFNDFSLVSLKFELIAVSIIFP